MGKPDIKIEILEVILGIYHLKMVKINNSHQIKING
jgi:hypothetical protein